MSKTHWLIGFLFFLIIMLASAGCKGLEWSDQSDLVDDFRYLPRMFTLQGDPRIKTAQETRAIVDRQAAATGLMSMEEFNRLEEQKWLASGEFGPVGPSSGIHNRIQPPRYYRHYGKILLIPNDEFSPAYKQYLRRKSYGKK